MKLLSWILIAVNSWFGIRAFLNAIHVLQTSKYSQTATVVFAILFLGMTAAGLYFLLAKQDTKLAFWTGLGPWLAALLFLLLNMLTQDYK